MSKLMFFIIGKVTKDKAAASVVQKTVEEETAKVSLMHNL